MPGRYASTRDEILDTMAREMWAEKSTGDCQSPVGWFALIINPPESLPEVHDAFREDIAREECDPQTLVGNFLLIEDDQGFVSVRVYEHADNARKAYDELAAEFDAWESEDDNA